MKIIPPGVSFRKALQAGYVGRIECEVYTKWVKTLPCVCCGKPADDPHHPHGVGYKGGATKVPDLWVIPLCRKDHDVLHHNFEAWEAEYGSQYEHAVLTLTQAFVAGVLVVSKPKSNG